MATTELLNSQTTTTSDRPANGCRPGKTKSGKRAPADESLRNWVSGMEIILENTTDSDFNGSIRIVFSCEAEDRSKDCDGLTAKRLAYLEGPDGSLMSQMVPMSENALACTQKIGDLSSGGPGILLLALRRPEALCMMCGYKL